MLASARHGRAPIQICENVSQSDARIDPEHFANLNSRIRKLHLPAVICRFYQPIRAVHIHRRAGPPQRSEKPAIKKAR